LTIIIGLLYLQLTDHANVPWAVDIIIFMQGFPETWKLFQGFLQGKKIEKVWSTPIWGMPCLSLRFSAEEFLMTATKSSLHSCLPLTIPYPLFAENESNSTTIPAKSVLLLKEYKQWQLSQCSGGRHHQRHLVVGVHSLIKPIKLSHFLASVSDPLVGEIWETS
jgi:hypothetical protein